MAELQFIQRDDTEFLKMQSRDAKEILGISKTQFYNDSAEYGWRKEEGIRGAVFHFVPRDYVEERLKEKKTLETTESQQSKPMEPAGQSLPSPAQSDGGQLSEAVRLLIESKDQQIANLEARIASLEASLEREQKLNDKVIESKEGEINAYKGMLLLSSGQANQGGGPESQTLEYAPSKGTPKQGLIERLKFWNH